MKSQTLTRWENQTDELTQEFVSKYFNRKGTYHTTWYWIGSNIGGTLEIADRFFDISDVVDAMRYNVPVNKLFSFYDYRLERQDAGKELEWNIKAWSKLKKK